MAKRLLSGLGNAVVPQLAQGIRDAEDRERWPELQHGFGFADGTGTFTRIVEDGAA